MNRDTVIGIVGCVILAAAMAGIFLYERANAATLAGDAGDPVVDYKVATLAGPSVPDAAIALGGSTDATVTLTSPNLTEVVFDVSWTATNGKDTVSVTVVPPQGVPANQTLTAKGDSGALQVKVQVPNAAPAAPGETARPGVGDWKVTLKFESATGVGSGQLPVPVQQDRSVTVKTKVTLAAFAAAS